jgi:glycosyltransferase involved in cell wall biosynthesis
MNICILTWEFPPRIVGGIARHCYGLSRALSKLGHEVYLVTLEFPGTPDFEIIEGTKVYRVRIELGHPNFITWALIFNHFMEKKVAMLSREVDFDVIHIHDWLTTLAGIIAKDYLNKPLVCTVHSTEVGRVQELRSPDSYLIDGLEWWMLYESKFITLCSNSMKKEVCDHFRVPSEKIHVIPNAIDTPEYKIKIDRESVKRRYGIDPSEKLVLYIGRLVPQKGVEYLIRAAPMILRNQQNAKFIIAGDGWSRNQLEGLAASMGLGNKIKFLGFISEDERIQLLLSADALVVPSLYEPFGIIALEGMAAGVPVIVSNVGGLSEIVEHDRTGMHAYAANPESIAWCVNKLLSDYEYSQWISENAKKRIKEQYSWEAAAKKTSEVYELACKR